MSPLTFNIIRQSTQRSAARRGTIVMNNNVAAAAAAASSSTDSGTATTKRVMETPGCFMHSVKGSIPHLTPDTLRLQQGYGGVHVSIEQILQDHQPAGLEKWSSSTASTSTSTSPSSSSSSTTSLSSSMSLSKFLHLEDFILLCDIRDPSLYARVPFNSSRYVSMKTQRGVRRLTLEEYLRIVRAYEPDIVAAFADSISDLEHQIVDLKDGQAQEQGQLIGPGPKRVQKSVERTLKWLDQILKERQGLDALAEDREIEKAKKSQKLDGGSSNIQDASSVNQLVQKTHGLHLESTQTTTNTAAPGTEPRNPFTGVGLFAHVVGAQIEQERIRSAEETAKRAGVDGFVIDTHTLPGDKDEKLRLLKISLEHLPQEKPRLVYGMQTPEDVLRSIALGADLFDTSYPSHLTEDGKASLYSFGGLESAYSTSESNPSNGNDSGNVISSKPSNRWINLWDEEHADKFVPLLEGCDCYACKSGRHTRAYINHLLKAHEMLATVLLMSHNMYQYSKFFANVRQSIQDGTFEQQSAVFAETFGTEPEPTGKIHAAQAVVEAALSKRDRFDGDDQDSEGAAAAAAAQVAAEERKQQKDKLKQARRTKKREEGMKLKMQKKQEKLDRQRKEGSSLQQEHEP